MMRLILSIILIFIAGNVCPQKDLSIILTRQNNHSVPYISATEARMMQLNGETLILDAREQKEYNVSKIPTAKYIGYREFSEENLKSLTQDKKQSIIVYCTVGIRSENIAEKLKNLGYTNVKNLYGGIFEWKNKGYPVLDPKGKMTQKVHTYSKAWEPYLTNGIKVN